MIRIIKEGEIGWLPGIQSSELPSPLPKGLSLHIRGTVIGIESQGLIGALPLKNGDTLQILPKVGQANFLKMLFRAEGYYPLNELGRDEFVEVGHDSDETLSAVVIRRFISSTEEIMRKSAIQGRVSKKYSGTYLNGTIDAIKTSFNIARRAEDPVCGTTKQKTVDIPENRIISEAVAIALRTLKSQTNQSLYLQILQKWLSKFPRSKNVRADLNHVDQGLSGERYGGARGYYRQALMLARIILGSDGISIDGSSKKESDSFLINTADIFEKYLRSTFINIFKEQGYVVSSSSGSKVSLYTDGSFELNPDIMIFQENKLVLLIDAKYKTPTSSDHYQLQAYLNNYKLGSGLLISPNMESDEVKVKEYMTPSGIVVREIYIPLGNLMITEAFLGSVIQKFA
ncbi:hypothetical protein J3362_06675 [Marinobacter sp. NFXS11]|uniref:5-methylcytosine restriction system specificity protein McrC n=1 Tax=Marinobacter sp. NFXS11 TaxID=2818432 RepID=UPI0032DF6632